MLRTRRTREINGPTPHSCAILARRTQINPEAYLLELRRQDELRAQTIKDLEQQKRDDIKTKWIEESDERVQKKIVKRRVDDILHQQSYELDMRRDKLRELFDTEEQAYLQELSDRQETTVERQAKMRERAKKLREKRERERQAYVDEKLEIRWRDGCDELRPILAKKQQADINVERAKQIEISQMLKSRQSEEDAYYDQLWESDRLMKLEREERENNENILRNTNCLKVLEKQLEAINLQRQSAAKQREDDAKWLAEEKKQLALEKENHLQAKKAKQLADRDYYSRQIKTKARRKAKELQEELAIDMKILEQLITETQNEAADTLKRKKELNEEAKAYMKYLEEQMIKEKETEAALESLVNEEVERQWEKRLAQWDKERVARRKMTEDMIRIRQQQMQEKLVQAELEREQLAKEREEVRAAHAEHERLEREKVERTKERNTQYQSDLLGQIQYSATLRSRDKEERDREYQVQQNMESDYQSRLQYAAETSTLNRSHPLRSQYRTRNPLFG